MIARRRAPLVTERARRAGRQLLTHASSPQAAAIMTIIDRALSPLMNTKGASFSAAPHRNRFLPRPLFAAAAQAPRHFLLSRSLSLSLWQRARRVKSEGDTHSALCTHTRSALLQTTIDRAPTRTTKCAHPRTPNNVSWKSSSCFLFPYIFKR